MRDTAYWGSRFDYLGLGIYESHCFIKRNGNVIICTEPPTNHGTSITNAAEDIATALCRKEKIEPKALVWIEHYIHDGQGEETFDLVDFKLKEGARLRDAHWTYLSRERALEIFEKGGEL